MIEGEIEVGVRLAGDDMDASALVRAGGGRLLQTLDWNVPGDSDAVLRAPLRAAWCSRAIGREG